jgi:hypothetical protein
MSKIDVYWVEMWGQFERLNIHNRKHIKYISYRISSLCIKLVFENFPHVWNTMHVYPYLQKKKRC